MHAACLAAGLNCRPASHARLCRVAFAGAAPDWYSCDCSGRANCMCPSRTHPAADRIPLHDVPHFVLFTVRWGSRLQRLQRKALINAAPCTATEAPAQRKRRMAQQQLGSPAPHHCCSMMMPSWKRRTPACGPCVMGAPTQTAAQRGPPCEPIWFGSWRRHRQGCGGRPACNAAGCGCPTFLRADYDVCRLLTGQLLQLLPAGLP